MWSAYHRAMAERVPIEVEDYYPPHQRWYRFRAFPSREGLAFYGQDVTAQRQLQEDLEHQRTLLETIIESTPDPIFTKDREGRYIMLNSAAADVQRTQATRTSRAHGRRRVSPGNRRRAPGPGAAHHGERHDQGYWRS